MTAHLRAVWSRLVRAAAKTYFHGTNRVLRPGDTLRPAALSGQQVFDASYDFYDPYVVYLTDQEHLAERYALRAVLKLGGEPHVYEVRPIGSCYQDPEAATGFGTDQWCATLGEVVREVPLPQLSRIQDGRVVRVKTALPSWRAQQGSAFWTEYDAVIATDANGRGRNFEVWTYGVPFATRPSLAEAKQAIEEVYGPLPWRRVTMPEVVYDHDYFGPLTEMTDPRNIYVTDLPRLGALGFLESSYTEGMVVAASDGLVSRALAIAEQVHAGQTDLQGRRYLDHPLAVAAAVDGVEAKVVALLHDVLEDSDHTPGSLMDEGIPEHLVASVVLLTHQRNEPYAAYIDRIVASGDRIAREVKLADVRHNLLRSEALPDDHEHKARLVAKYQMAQSRLA